MINLNQNITIHAVCHYCENTDEQPFEVSIKKALPTLEKKQDEASWHLRLYNNIDYSLYFDIDEGNLTADQIKNHFNEVPQFKNKKICITQNERADKKSFHIVFPELKGTLQDQKQIITGWNNDYPDFKADTLVYNDNRLFRLPNQLKPNSDIREVGLIKNTRHNIIAGEMYDFLLIPYENAEQLPKAPEKKNFVLSPVSSHQVPTTDIDKLIDCLSSERATKYETWIQVGFCLRNIETDDCANLNAWKKFSSKSTGDVDPHHSLETKYKGFKPMSDKSNIDTLKIWARKDNLDLYKKYFNDEPNYFMCASIFSKGMREMCIAIHQELFKTIRYCLDVWWVFDKNTGLWCSIKNPASKFIELFNKYFNYNIIRITKELMKDNLEADKKDLLVRDRKLFTEAYVKYDLPGSHTLMKTHFSDLLKDDKFVEKLNILRDCIAFDNGIYNLKTGIFTKGIKYDDYLTCKLNFEYLDDIDISKAEERVEKVIKQICSMEEWRFKYYKTILGYAMTGRANEQQAFYSMTGLGSNGKSFIFEKLSKIFPEYVYKIPSNTFERECKEYNKNISSVIGKRIVWSNELSKNKACDADKLKDFSDGTIMNVPWVYKQNPVCIQNNAKLFLIGNQNPKFASDGGIDRRLRSINFVSRFYKKDDIIPFPTNPNPNTDYWEDNTIDSFFDSQEGQLALFRFVAEGAKMYFQDGIQTPVQFKELAEEVANANNQFIEFINENLELVEEGKGVVHKEELMAVWKKEKGRDCNFDDLRSELIRRKFIYDYKKQKKINGKPKTGCFTNMRIIVNNNECLLDDDDAKSQASTNSDVYINGVIQAE